MADSSKQPIRGADLDALKRKLGQLKKDAAGVLDALNAEAETLNQRLAQANQQLDKEAVAEERVSKARSRRKPPAEAAAGKRQEATSSERLAAAEERAAKAAQSRATAERAAAKAAQDAAAAVERSARAPLALGAGARFTAGAGGTTDVLGQQALQRAAERERLVNELFRRRQLQLPAASSIQLGPAGSTPSGPYNPQGGVGGTGPPFAQFGAQSPSRFAQAMAKQTEDARKLAAAEHVEASAAAKSAAEHRLLVDETIRGNQSLRTFGNAIDFNALRLGQASNQYQRNGYLTSEFINAAARGEVTIRELGSQVGGTIAKFAGWTAAASAVYGAVRAIQQLGAGALASESGVNQLSRVVTVDLPGGADEAKQKFRELSREFNLPIADVVEAAYGMAKAFHGDLPQAFEATKDALFAVKVGELSAADATRYLTAIVNGFGLSAGQLHDVFDALNQVQNRFGGNITNVAAGVAKAAGSFKTAGGDYLTLVKLIEAGVKVSGATGENVGTAFSRSAGRVLTDAGRKAIADVGLNPDLNYPELFGQALAKSKGASPRTIAAIARALVPSGGQFTRILLPILENPDLLGSIDQSLEKRAGSAERERKKALQSPSEQLKRLSTDAQQLGSALGESGALTPLLGLVKGTDELVHGLTEAVDLADRIAGPFKGALIPVLEIAAAIKLMRRFDLGSVLPAGTPGTPYANLRGGLQRPTGDVFDAAIGKGSRDVRQELLRNYQTSLRTANTNALRANATGAQAEQLESQIGRAGSQEEEAALQKKLAATQAANLRYADAQVAAEIEANAIQGELASREAQLVEYKKARLAGLNKEAAAVKAGFAYKPSLETNDAGSPTPLAGGGAKQLSLFPREDAAGKIDQQARAEKAAIEEQSRVSRSMQRLGLVGTGLAAGAGFAKTSAEVAGRGLRSAGAGFASLARSLGPLDYLLITAFGIPLLIDAAKGVRDRAKKAQDKIHDAVGGAPGVRQNANQLQKHGNIFAQAGQQVSDIFNDPLSTFTAGSVGGPSPSEQRYQKAQSAFDQAQRVASTLAREQPAGRLLDISAIRRQLSERYSSTQDATSRIDGIQTAIQQAQSDFIALAEKTFGKGFKQGKGGRQAQAALLSYLRQQLAAERAAQAQAIGPAALDLGQLKDYSAGTGARLELQGPTHANTQRLRLAVARLRQLAAGASSDDDIKKVVDNVQALQQAAQTIVDRYSRQADGVTDPRAKARIQVRGVQAAKRALGADKLEARLRDARAQFRAASNQVDRDEAAIARIATAAGQESGGRQSQGPVGPIGQQLSKLHARAEKDKARVARAKGLMSIVEGILRGVFSTLNQTGAQAAADLRQANEELYSARTDYLAAQAGGGLAGDQVRVGRLRGDPYQKVKKGSADWYQHETEILTTQQQIADQQRQQAQDAAQKAQQAAQQAREDAKALVSAQADFAASKTVDPVALARIRLQEAERLARYASGKAEQLEAKANVNNTRRDLKNATYQSRLDDIEFYASIGKLSHDAEIAQLEALLKRVKGNKDLRRQIRQKLYDLKHDAASDTNLDINVADLRLPTIYDVRRLAKQGLAAATVLQQSNSYHFSVRSDSDIERLGGELETIHGPGVRAAMRSAGLRG